MGTWKDRINGRVYYNDPYEYWCSKTREELDQGVKDGEIRIDEDIEIRNGEYLGTWKVYCCKDDYEQAIVAYREYDHFFAEQFEKRDKQVA